MTKSQSGTRTCRLELELRDFALQGFAPQCKHSTLAPSPYTPTPRTLIPTFYARTPNTTSPPPLGHRRDIQLLYLRGRLGARVRDVELKGSDLIVGGFRV